MRVVLAILAVLLLAPLLLSAVQGTTHAEPLTFSIISYNVQFLPGLASGANKRKEPEYRAKRIAQAVSTFDIVALQETFHETHRPILVDELRAKWNAEMNLVVAPMPEGFMANGGTLIATRFPIVESNSCVYTEFSKPADYGIEADGFAAKGATHARIELEAGTPIDLFNTHLEAREPLFRPSQYSELADLIAAKGELSIPALVVGDLNTNGGKEQRALSDSLYNQLLAELKRARPGGTIIDAWLHLHPDANGGTTKQESESIGNRIDYIIILNPPDGPQLAPLTMSINTYPDDKVEYLSDHNAVLATVQLNR